jgi:membrane-associated phospholipid phosphatase
MQSLIIKIMADYLMVPIILIGAYALLFKVKKSHRIECYSRILVAGLTAYLLAKLIGYVFQPSSLRPFEILGTTAGASFLNNPGFPSDHILLVSALAFAVWFETKQKNLAIIMFVLVILVAIGRVMALVHTPLDVIGAVVIAGMGSLWYMNSKCK